MLLLPLPPSCSALLYLQNATLMRLVCATCDLYMPLVLQRYIQNAQQVPGDKILNSARNMCDLWYV